jgi:hypothetical protein
MLSVSNKDKNNYEESPTICILDAGNIFIYLLEILFRFSFAK